MLVFVLGGCTRPDPRIAYVQQEAQAAADYYGFGLDATKLNVAFVGLPDNPGEWHVRGMVPWPNTILLAEEFPKPPWVPELRETVAHEVVHLMQGARVGYGNWIPWYLANRKAAEAEAYDMAAKWRRSVE